MNKKKAIVSDECLDQADECYNFGSNTIQNPNRTSNTKQPAKNSVNNPASQAAAGSAASEGSNKSSEALIGGDKAGGSAHDSTAWSQNQQKQLELALQQYPKTVADRWTCIAQAVPGKTKVGQSDCRVEVCRKGRKRKGSLRVEFDIVYIFSNVDNIG